MDYYKNKNNVTKYIKMAEGYDGKKLIDILKKYLVPGSSVLELGMGPGVDLYILNKTYKATGSDNSQIFLELYKEKNDTADVILLDAICLDTDRKYDCIYSNKVLMHLTKDELKKSLSNQSNVLNDNGLLFHSFWYGDKKEEFDGLFFQYYTEATLAKLIDNTYEIVEMQQYTEMEENDSLYVILKK